MAAFILLLTLLLLSPNTSQMSSWLEFSTRAGNFKVNMPILTEWTKGTEKTDFGPLDYHSIQAADNNLVLYMVGYSDYPKEALQKLTLDNIVEQTCNRMLADGKTKIFNESPVSLGVYPGRAFTFETKGSSPDEPEIRAINRFYFVNNRLYRLSVVVAKGRKIDPVDVEKFFDSFKLIEDPAAEEKQGEIIKMPGDGITPPQVYLKVKPKYTREARNYGIQGIVVLSSVFSKDGTISGIKVVRGLGYGLDDAAIEAAEKIKFKPGEKDGQTVNVQARLEFTFSLKDDPKAESK
jgi:TonB family protein